MEQRADLQVSRKVEEKTIQMQVRSRFEEKRKTLSADRIIKSAMIVVWPGGCKPKKQ